MNDRPQNIEDRILALSQKATPGPWGVWPEPSQTDRPTLVQSGDGSRGHDDVVVGIQHGQYDNGRFIASCSPEVVAAMCRVIAAARVGCHHRCAEKMFVRHVPECVVGAALAALDEMGRKA